MKIVILDGYSVNPGDLSWAELESCGELTVYDRTAADEVAARAKEADAESAERLAKSVSRSLGRGREERAAHMIPCSPRG